MDRAPAAVAPSQHRQSIADMETILRERDEDIRYTLEHSADDTRPRGLTEVRVSCGCEGWPLKSCSWHQHVSEALEDAQDIVVSYERQCMPWADWTAVRRDYDGAPDSHCPIGHGADEDAAVNDLREQEEA